MGRDKALLDCGGQALWRRQWELLEKLGARERLLSVRPEQTWAPADAVKVFDARPGLGPIGGIAAALERGASGHLLVLAVDLPRMEPAWFARLFALCNEASGAIGKRGGNFEPLAAVYPQRLLPSMRAALARGEHSLQKLLTAAVAEGLMRSCQISDEERRWFANWNAPDDFRALPG